MDAIISNAFTVLPLLIAVCALHVFEDGAKKAKWVFTSLNIVLHIFTFFYFLNIGASMEELLLFLLLSFAVAVA